MSHHHCDDFSRAELLRATFASAGRGLPGIERGMPAPAGTGLSRRSFLSRAGGLALAVYGAGALGPRAFDAGIESAAAAVAPTDPILVSVFMPGGLDGLSLLVPAGISRYADLRPGLKIQPGGAADRFRDDDRLYWAPEAAPLRDLHAAGKLTVAPAIGYAHPDQSHFTSRHFWEVGALDPGGRIGWLGRYLDRHGSPDNPLQGLSLDWTLAPSLAPDSVPVAAVAEPERFDLWTRNVWDDGLQSGMMDALGELGRLSTDDAGLAVARREAARTSALRDQLSPMQGREFPFQTAVAYPDEDAFPRQLAGLAQMIALGLPLRCVALTANGGYDTHDDQAGSLPRDLDVLARSLAAFQADLERRGIADRVLVHVWSEFGRRAEENGGGTDHGAAGLSLLMGTRVSGKTVGQFPGLGTSQLDADGNLKATADFRGFYASLTEQWLGVDADGIVPGAADLPRYALVG
ncbi:MAG TPA: DUF1501 domain-containing protein [Solirubrobacteraceae bacterium]|jgi:uncharacterized protein (DUF1501 family)